VEAPSIYDSIAAEPGAGVVLELPVAEGGGTVPERMLHQTRHGKPVLGGYLARGEPRPEWETRPGFRELQAMTPLVADVAALEQPAAAARAVLARHGVATIVIDKARAGPDLVARARGVVPALVPGAVVVADDPAVLAYRLPPSRPATSFLHLDGPGAGWQALEPALPAPDGFPARFRWMQEQGRLTLHAAEAGTWRLAVKGWAFRRARRVALLVDGRRVGEATFGAEPDSYPLPPFTVEAGWHALELRSLDGAEARAPQTAAVSVAAAEIRLQAVPPLGDGARLALGAAAAGTYLGQGWSGPEGLYRWTDGPRATLFLPRATSGAALLRLRVRPFLGGGAGATSQRLRLQWSGRRLGEVELRGPATLRAVLEPETAAAVPTLSFDLPDASPPAGGGEKRALGVAVEWLGVDPPPAVSAGSVLPLVQGGWLAVEPDGGRAQASAPPWPLVAAFALDRPAAVRLDAGLRLADPARSPALRVQVNGREVERLDGGGPPRLAVVLGPGDTATPSVLALGPDGPAPEGPGGAVVLGPLTLAPAPSLPPGQDLRLASSRAEPFLGRGWSDGEGTQRWTDGSRARLVLGAGEPAVLRLRLRPFLAPPRLARQRIVIEQEGRPLAAATLDETTPSLHAVAVPRRGSPGVLTLSLPDAASPASLGVRADPRRLGVAAEWMRLDPFPELALGSTLAVGGEEAAPYLGAGWSEGEGAFRWTEAPAAELFLDGPAHAGALLELRLRPLVAPPAIPRQRLEVRAGGRSLGVLDLSSPEVAPHTVFVPAGLLSGPSVLRFELPDAVRPADRGLGSETRRLGVALHALRLRPALPLAPQERLALGGAQAEGFLGEGWSRGEGALRWTDGTRAELLFGMGAPGPRVLQLRLRPLVDAAHPRQRLRLRLNGRELATLTLTNPAPAVYAVALPPEAYAGLNRLELLTPDALVPALAGAGPDTRRLGVAVYWLRFAPWF
jgi:hypothetical protein